MDKLTQVPVSIGTMRIAFHELTDIIEVLGWSAEEMFNNDYPNNTVYWTLKPIDGPHIDSDKMKKFLFAVGRYDIEIDYRAKQIRVYV